MLELMNYTETQQKKLLNSMVVLVDTREQKNEHVTRYFDENNINWKKMKLDYGDYSFMIPANAELGIQTDLYFNKKIMVEKKNSFEELIKNLTEDKGKRLRAEFSGAPPDKILLIENSSYGMMAEGRYDSQYNPKSLWASIFALWHRYGVPCLFINDKKYTGEAIYGYLYYYLRNLIR